MSLVRLFPLSKPISLCAGMALLAACSSRPVEPARKPSTEPVSPIIEPQPADSPEALLAQARTDWQENADVASRNRMLLQAARMYLDQNQVAEAQTLLKAIQQDTGTKSIAQQANLLIAQIYLHDAKADTETLFSLVSPLASQPEVRQQQLLIQSELYTRQSQWLAAAEAYAQAGAPSEETVQRIWHWVNRAPEQQFTDAEQRYPTLRPYLALKQLITDNGLNRKQLASASEQFKQVYRGHPLVDYWPAEIQQLIELNLPRLEEVVVLLPLSGRYAETGGAIKQGILAAYFEQQAKLNPNRKRTELRFVDTVDKSPQQLVEAIGTTRWVIGPLLKETIDALLPVLPPDVYLLALNRIDPLLPAQIPEASVPDRKAYFALAPEDEADQLAEHIFHSGYRTPIVVSAESTIQQRMLEEFELRWQQLNVETNQTKPIPLTKVTFTDSNSLREGITRALDVAQSKQRIDQIRYMVNEELYNVPRNRRDVDAIVVFASPEQTELLNPMIEASLSPFNEKPVPVYATSRSMEYDSGKNQWRDLQNVRFMDMPWLLPNTPWPDLKAQTQELWPQRSTAMSRLFAFGVDAYQLIPYLPNLALLPQVSVNGLTGELSMNHQREIVRTLPQAMVDNERVKLVAE